MAPPDSEHALSHTVQESWHRFLDVYESLRPELYRYCRYLTRSPWDAEDLVQDTLARAFVTLGWLFTRRRRIRARGCSAWPQPVDRPDAPRARGRAGEPPGARADAPRRARPRRGGHADRPPGTAESGRRSCSRTCSTSRLDEIAARAVDERRGGKGRAAPRPRQARRSRRRRRPTRPRRRRVLDAFCDAFNARDLDRLTALLLDTATVEIVGLVTEYGPEARAPIRRRARSRASCSATSQPTIRAAASRRTCARASSPRRRASRCAAIAASRSCSSGTSTRTARPCARWPARARRRPPRARPQLLLHARRDRRGVRELAVPFRANGYKYW